MFAHTLEEQIKEPMRQYIYNMLYEWEDLSDINLNEEKSLLDELIILTKECKNCMSKKCPGGYNCKFGVCLRENKICYNDLMYGKCYNMLMETNDNGYVLYKCIHGIHLSEKKLIPYNQRMLTDLTNIETNFLIRHNVSFNSKNNIISLCLNDNTINMVKDIVSNKLNKTEILNNLKTINNLFVDNNGGTTETIVDNEDDNILDDIINNKNNDTESDEENNNISDDNKINDKIYVIDKQNTTFNVEDEKNLTLKNDKIIINYETNDIMDNIVVYDD
jgi:hypothetical protein